MKIGSAATALGCSHGLTYSIMHARSEFRKVCARRVARELKNRMGLSLQHLLWHADIGEELLDRTVTGDESLPTQFKAYSNAMETLHFTFAFNQKFKVTP
jgi:cell division protein FtsB